MIQLEKRETLEYEILWTYGVDSSVVQNVIRIWDWSQMNWVPEGFWELEFNLVLHTVILHSQIIQERPQITSDHPQKFQNRPFRTFL